MLTTACPLPGQVAPKPRIQHGNVPASVMKEISDLQGRAAIRGQHGFVLRDGGSNARAIVELFSGTTRLAHALAQHCTKNACAFSVEAYEILRSPSEDLEDEVRL